MYVCTDVLSSLALSFATGGMRVEAGRAVSLLEVWLAMPACEAAVGVSIYREEL